MPNKKISELNENTTPSGDNILPIVNSGETEYISLSGISNFLSAQQNNGISLLGKFIGINFNPTPVALIEPIIDYDTLVGTFQIGETITNLTGSTGIIISDDGSSEMVISGVSGTFIVGDTITGLTSNTTANINTYTDTQPADQLIVLSGGNTYIITDVIITSASTNISGATDFQIRDGIMRTGNAICLSFPHTLVHLITPNNFVNSNNGDYTSSNRVSMRLNFNQMCVGGNLYVSFGTPQGTPASANIYVYGYILN